MKNFSSLKNATATLVIVSVISVNIQTKTNNKQKIRIYTKRKNVNIYKHRERKMWLTKACAHVKSHQQTDRRSIDAERKSSDSHTAHSTLNAIFYIVICNFFLCLFARAWAHCCAVLQHTTILSVSLLNTHQTNENERHAYGFLSSFNEYETKQKPNCCCLSYILFWRREEEKKTCALVTLNRLVSRFM